MRSNTKKSNQECCGRLNRSLFIEFAVSESLSFSVARCSAAADFNRYAKNHSSLKGGLDMGKNLLILVATFLLCLIPAMKTEAAEPTADNPEIHALDSETFIVSFFSSKYLFKIRNDKLILVKGNDLYSTHNTTNYEKYPDKKGTFQRLKIDIQ